MSVINSNDLANADAAAEHIEAAFEMAQKISGQARHSGYHLITAAILAVGIVALKNWFDFTDERQTEKEKNLGHTRL